MPERVPINAEDVSTDIVVKQSGQGRNGPPQNASLDPRFPHPSDALMPAAPVREAEARSSEERLSEPLGRSAVVGGPPPKKPRQRLSLRTMLTVGGVLVVGVVAFVMWLRGGRYASTDDAYVQSAKLVVSTDVSGIVATN